MLAAIEIAAMRETQEQALPDTCTRNRYPLTSNGAGGYTKGAAEAIVLPCRVSSRGLPDEYLRQSAAISRHLMMITVPHGSDVRHTDELVCNGLTYRVIGFASAGDWETALRCVCEVIA
ncbi:MAG: head-tail adaptor protein [Armatimonadia bacterium]